MNCTNYPIVTSENQNDTAFLQKSMKFKNAAILESKKSNESTSVLREETLDVNFNSSVIEFEDLPKLLQCEKNRSAIAVETTEQQKTYPQNDISVETDVSYEIVNESRHLRSEKKAESREEVRKQILNIQYQLHKLSKLPSIIQMAIEDITNQVSVLIPEIKMEGEFVICEDEIESIESVNEGNENVVDLFTLNSSRKQPLMEGECEQFIEEQESNTFEVEKRNPQIYKQTNSKRVSFENFTANEGAPSCI